MGTHLLVEVYNVPFEKLNDAKKIEQVCTLTLGESHLSCHTWPEKGCVAFDIFTCGAKNPRCVAWWVLEYFDTDDYIMKDFAR